MQHSTAGSNWSLLKLSEGKELALTRLDLFTQSQGGQGRLKNVLNARVGRPIEKCLQSSLKEKPNKKASHSHCVQVPECGGAHSPQELLL